MRLMKRLAAFLLCCLLPAAAFAEHAAQVTVDFSYLQQLNPDCVGWLYQPESGLNAPIMRHETDEWYRERAFDEVKVYQTGSLYIHTDETIDGRLVIVRGQAREEGCLGMLPGWETQETADERSAFTLLTPQGNARAEVFACVRLGKKEGLESWLPPETGVAEWAQTVILPASLITCDPQNLPEETDRMLFVVGGHLNGSSTVVMATLRPVGQAAGELLNLIKLEMDSRETQNGMAEVGPVGPMMIYAQNDSLYAKLRYESGTREGVNRDFGGGGCGPTAMAIIAANLLTPEELSAIRQYTLDEQGTRFCACSVNRLYCKHLCVPYPLQTPQEYLRYLPIAMADFAAGNNQWEFVARSSKSQGTNIRFVDYVCEAYGLTAEAVNGLDTALELMKERTDQGFILASALRGSPYTNTSHFVVIAGVDETYFYVIDPLRRTEKEYLKTDSREILELLSPGVTRIHLTDYGRSDLSPMYYISRGK